MYQATASSRALSFIALCILLLLATTAKTDAVVYGFTGPVFDIERAPDGSLLVADATDGVFEVRKGVAAQIASLRGVTDVAPIGRGNMFVVTSHGFGGDGQLYRISRGSVRPIADLAAFEAAVNPDRGIIESNPFDIAPLNGGSVLVADAAANALLVVNQRGQVDWVATFPNEVVSTANAKAIAGCPAGPPRICGLPPAIPAQAVPTSVVIGPDGAYYVGELKGFPAPTGESRVWRIEPGTRHAVCGVSPACQVVADGFTSIIDLTFGPDGTLYVVELDEASWFALEFGAPAGGTVNACNIATWSCNPIATDLLMVTAAAVDKRGRVTVVTNALIPGGADIRLLP